MRIRVVQKPPPGCTKDGLDPNNFEVGHIYEVSSLLCSLLLAEKWAVLEEDGEDQLLQTSRAEAEERRKKLLGTSSHKA